jgi:CheY-like chemotaxis protein
MYLVIVAASGVSLAMSVTRVDISSNAGVPLEGEPTRVAVFSEGVCSTLKFLLNPDPEPLAGRQERDNPCQVRRSLHLVSRPIWIEALAFPAGLPNMSEQKIVLVVEDDANDSLLLQMAAPRLRAMPICHYVGSGDEAVKWLQAQAGDQGHYGPGCPDLILLDWNLPGFEGATLVEWIRSRAEYDGVEVIVWSGSLDPSQKRRALQAGADRFLLKPALFEEFANTWASLLTGNERPTPPVVPAA